MHYRGAFAVDDIAGSIYGGEFIFHLDANIFYASPWYSVKQIRSATKWVTSIKTHLLCRRCVVSQPARIQICTWVGGGSVPVQIKYLPGPTSTPRLIKFNARLRMRHFATAPLALQPQKRGARNCGYFLFNTWSNLRILLRGYLLLSMRYCHDRRLRVCPPRSALPPDPDSPLTNTSSLLCRRHFIPSYCYALSWFCFNAAKTQHRIPHSRT